MRCILTLMESFCLKELHFINVLFEDPTQAAQITAAGLAAQARVEKDENKVFLQRLCISIEYALGDSDPEDIWCIVRALNGNARVQVLDIFYEAEGLLPVLQAMAQDLLPHASCHLYTLGLHYGSSFDDDEEEALPDEMPDQLWDAFRQNSSLRRVTILPMGRNELHEQDMSRLYQLLANPDNTILSFSVGPHPLHTMARLVLEEESQTEAEDTSNGAFDQKPPVHYSQISHESTSGGRSSRRSCPWLVVYGKSPVSLSLRSRFHRKMPQRCKPVGAG